MTPPPLSGLPLVTTGFTLHGYKITRELGIVRGIIVRSRSVIGSFGAALQTLLWLLFGQGVKGDFFHDLLRDG